MAVTKFFVINSMSGIMRNRLTEFIRKLIGNHLSDGNDLHNKRGNDSKK